MKIDSLTYHYNQYRKSCLLFAAMVIFTIHGIIGAIIAAQYGMPETCVAAVVAAVFFGFIARIKLNDAKFHKPRAGGYLY